MDGQTMLLLKMHPGWTFPPFKMHPDGTAPLFKFPPRGTVPPFKMHHGGTLNIATLGLRLGFSAKLRIWQIQWYK